jgi:dienelactone hydrolase
LVARGYRSGQEAERVLRIEGSTTFGLVLSLALFAPLSARAADRTYGVVGPRAVETKTEPKSKAAIVKPVTGGAAPLAPAPLIVASHGFAGSGDNQIGWARHFASWGFVVAVPSFPSPFAPNHAANAATIKSLVTELMGPAAAAFGVAPGKYGLEGHSAGGLSTTLAAADLAPSAVVLFDPVDAAGAGKIAYGKPCAPVLGIFAAPGTCNSNAGWRAFASETPGDLVAFDVVGSTHCDGENEPRVLCGPFCGGGGANATRQAAYAHYATAFFLANLSGDMTAAAVLAAGPMASDTEIADILRATGTCPVPAADGGSTAPPAADDAGPSDTNDAGGGKGSGTAPSDPAGPITTDTGGCGCRAMGTRRGSLLAVAAGLLVAIAARRRRSTPR